MKATIKECNYRSDGYCLKDLANDTGDLEPCDYCNSDIDYEYQPFEPERNNTGGQPNWNRKKLKER